MPLGADDSQLHANALRDALKLREQGSSQEAGVALERLASESDVHPVMAARIQNALGLIRRDQGRWSEAVSHFETALEYVPADTTNCFLHPTITGNLGEVRIHQARLRDARALFQDAFTTARSCRGNDDFASLQLLNLAGIARIQGDYKLARQLAERAERQLREHLGHNHPHSILALNNLAQTYAAQGKHRQAIAAMEHVRDLALKVHGERHPLYSGVLSNLGVAYYVKHRYDAAEALMREALTLDERTYGLSHPSVVRDLNNLGVLLDATNRTDEARILLLRALEISRGHGCPDLRAMASLGAIELGRRRVDAAARWFSEVSDLVRTGAMGPDPDLAKRLEQFALALRSVNRAAEAERYEVEAMRLRTKALIETRALRALNDSKRGVANTRISKRI
jgi:tetratricopeptide (TPR) repeat protein